MTELQGDGGARPMHVLRGQTQPILVCAIDHRCLRSYTSLLGDADELCEHQAGTRSGRRLEVGPGRDRHPIWKGEFANAEWREHRRRTQPHGTVWRACRCGTEPGVDRAYEIGMALGQVDGGD